MTEDRSVVNNRPQLLVTDGISKNPTIIYFSPGMGQDNANGTQLYTLDSLYDNGSPFQLAKDGKLTNYVVVCLQGSGGFAANPWEVFATMKLVIAKYGTNGVRIMTGLSMGAQSTLDVAGQDTEKIFTAYVEMSTPGTSTSDWSKLPGKVLCFHGALDGGNTPYQRSVDAVNAINLAKRGFAYLITKPKDGHGGWPENYSAKFDIPGFGNMTWLEWATDSSLNPSKLFTATGTTAVVTGGTTTKPVSNSKAVAKATIVNGTVTLDSSGSINAGSYYWEVKAPGAAAFAWMGLSGGKGLETKTVTGYTKAGDWQFKLTIQDASGESFTDTATVTIGAVASQPPPVVIPAKTLLHTIKVYNDGSIETV